MHRIYLKIPPAAGHLCACALSAPSSSASSPHATTCYGRTTCTAWRICSKFAAGLCCVGCKMLLLPPSNMSFRVPHALLLVIFAKSAVRTPSCLRFKCTLWRSAVAARASSIPLACTRRTPTAPAAHAGAIKLKQNSWCSVCSDCRYHFSPFRHVQMCEHN